MKELKNWILSPSGYRCIFASNNDQESFTSNISFDNAILTSLCCYNLVKKDPSIKRILIGRDSRPTGLIIANICIKTLLNLGLSVDYTDICCAPEFFCFSNEYDSFIYISASHNPIGHNGFKFGSNGGVYEPEFSKELISSFKELSKDKDLLKHLEQISRFCDKEKLLQVYARKDEIKKRSYKKYLEFTILTSNINVDKLRNDIKDYNIGIVGDINGSARSTSIDKAFLEELGCTTFFDCNTPGLIKRAIVPEGENLNNSAFLLESLYKENNCFNFAYKPDCDGDRGNIVSLDENNKPFIIQAQQLFALMVATELVKIRKQDENSKVAIVCNGPTSKIVDDIAKCFNTSVFRAEVGEANVVSLANKKRDEGFIVKILGEGSNGGNITYPSKVRDPMQTILSLLQLLCDKSLIDFYCEKMNKEKITGKVTIKKLIDLLPKYTTTGSYSSVAKMNIKNASIKDLKINYEKEFISQWPQIKKDYNFYSYKLIKNEGIVEQTGDLGISTGGSKIEFYDENNNFIAYIWMRPSGTEPVFRVSCDVKNDNKELHDSLIKLHRSLIEKSDR